MGVPIKKKKNNNNLGPLASPELWLVQKEVCIKLIKPKTGDKNRKRTDHQKISQTLLATANSTHENASSLSKEKC